MDAKVVEHEHVFFTISQHLNGQLSCVPIVVVPFNRQHFPQRANLMRSFIVKHSVVVRGHKTSVSLEDSFWGAISEIAHAQGTTVSKVIADIDKTREQNNLSSAIRVFVLNYVRSNRGSGA
jgi:predicted DNA-binding ribbon-helix-helix protein